MSTNQENNCEGCGSVSKIWVPPNSVITRIASDTVNLQPPAGYVYCGTEIGTGKIIASLEAGANICCACTYNGPPGSGSCNAGTCGINPDGIHCTGQDCGGVQCGCSQSVVIKNIKGIGNDDNNLTALNPAPEHKIQNGGYFDITEGIHFVNIGDEFIPAIFDQMLEVPFVANAYKAFLNRIYRNSEVPKMFLKDSRTALPINGYCLTVINIFGRAAVIQLPIGTRNLYGMVVGSAMCCDCTDPNTGNNPCGQRQVCCTANPQGGCSYGCPGNCCNGIIDKGGNTIYSIQNYVF